MAITLDATKGGAAANSYATLEEASDYIDAIPGAEEWAELSEDEKTRLLAYSTRMIDRLPPLYDKFDSAQRLNFPMLVDGTEGGFERAKEACIVQAAYLMRNAEMIAEGQSLSIQGVGFEKIGPTGKSIKGYNQLRKYDSLVYSLLVDYVNLELKIGRG